MELFEMTKGHVQGLVAGAAGLLAMVAINVVPAAAASVTATATISAGTLGFVGSGPSSSLSFSDTLNGTNQTATSPETLDVSDATGSGAGWNLTASGTAFTSGAHTLNAASLPSSSAVADACDSSVTCTPATNAITYPWTMSTTAAKFYDASLTTGMGDQTVTATWNLAVPANTYAGAYTSTWTISLTTGP
jgi:hypothetical protein